MNADELELILYDRLNVIREMDKKYGLKGKAYISFSGGKDSTLLHYLFDEALPGNDIPRVFINTGIEYNAIREFAMSFGDDKRFVYLNPSVGVIANLMKNGYPFKSKDFSQKVAVYQHSGMDNKTIGKFLGKSHFGCPKYLRYVFEPGGGLPFKCSDMCCRKMKKEPAKKWAKENGKTITVTGMKRDEGGNRNGLGCVVTNKDGSMEKFHPLAVVTEEWEEWYAKKRGISFCELYYPPYNFKRTGCKGCPFNLNLQSDLDTMRDLMPNEWKQCETIWKPVYAEYRRIGYRLRKEGEMEQMHLYLKGGGGDE